MASESMGRIPHQHTYGTQRRCRGWLGVRGRRGSESAAAVRASPPRCAHAAVGGRSGALGGGALLCCACEPTLLGGLTSSGLGCGLSDVGRWFGNMSFQRAPATRGRHPVQLWTEAP